jgi:hypothetical protein
MARPDWLFFDLTAAPMVRPVMSSDLTAAPMVQSISYSFIAKPTCDIIGC